MNDLDLTPYRVGNPGRDLAMIRVNRQRNRIIDKANEMAGAMGMPLIPRRGV